MRYWVMAGVLTICGLQTAQPQGAKQFVQVELVKTVKAKKAKVGDTVKARVMQNMSLADGTTLLNDAIVQGQVRSADETSLAISFDQVEVKGKPAPMKFSIRGAMMPEPAGFAGKASEGVKAESGSVIGMPTVKLEVDEGPQRASKFTTSEKELQLKQGLLLML